MHAAAIMMPPIRKSLRQFWCSQQYVYYYCGNMLRAYDVGLPSIDTYYLVTLGKETNSGRALLTEPLHSPLGVVASRPSRGPAHVQVLSILVRAVEDISAVLVVGEEVGVVLPVEERQQQQQQQQKQTIEKRAIV